MSNISIIDYTVIAQCDVLDVVLGGFGFESGIWVLIAPVPGHCIPVTSIMIDLGMRFSLRKRMYHLTLGILMSLTEKKNWGF